LSNPPRTLNSVVTNLTLSGVDERSPELAKTSLFVLRRDDTSLPRTHSWNFTISQRLPKQIILETSYVGSYSENLLNVGHGNINLVPEGATLANRSADFNSFRPFQNYAIITEAIHSVP